MDSGAEGLLNSCVDVEERKTLQQCMKMLINREALTYHTSIRARTLISLLHERNHHCA